MRQVERYSFPNISILFFSFPPPKKKTTKKQKTNPRFKHSYPVSLYHMHWRQDLMRDFNWLKHMMYPDDIPNNAQGFIHTHIHTHMEFIDMGPLLSLSENWFLCPRVVVDTHTCSCIYTTEIGLYIFPLLDCRLIVFITFVHIFLNL